jgi:hypothetical protein
MLTKSMVKACFKLPILSQANERRKNGKPQLEVKADSNQDLNL